MSSHDAILASGANLIRRGGAGRATVQATMAGAGLTVGAFYAHFEDKEHLVEAAFTVALDQMSLLMEEAAAGLTGVAAVRAVADAYLSEEHRDALEAGCPLPALCAESAVNDSAATRKLLAEGIATLARRARSVAPGLLGDAEALAFVEVLVAGQILARALRGHAMSDQVLADHRRRADQLIGAAGSGVRR